MKSFKLNPYYVSTLVMIIVAALNSLYAYHAYERNQIAEARAKYAEAKAILQNPSFIPAPQVPIYETALYMMGSERCKGAKADELSPAIRQMRAKDFDRILNEMGGRHEEKEAFVLLACQESKYRANAKSHANAHGISQMLLSTAQMEADRLGFGKLETNDLYDPQISITLGYSHFRYLLSLTNGNIARAFAAYNGGPGGSTYKAMKVGANGVLETASYVTNIFDMMEERRLKKAKLTVAQNDTAKTLP